MRETMRRTDHVCYWRRQSARGLRSIPDHLLVSTKNGFVTWLEGEVLYRERLATIDDLILIGHNHGPFVNDLQNLVAAC